MSSDSLGTVQIVRKRGSMAGTHTLYRSESAAREAGHSPVFWKRAQEGDWALSDDGYAAEVLSRVVYGRRQVERAFLTTPVCRVWVSNTAKLEIGRYSKPRNSLQRLPMSFGTNASHDYCGPGKPFGSTS